MTQTTQDTNDLYDHLKQLAAAEWEKYQTASGESLELLRGTEFDSKIQARYHHLNTVAAQAYGASQAYRDSIHFILNQNRERLKNRVN